MTFRFDDNTPRPSLLVPCRVNVFGTREIARRKKTTRVGLAWQGWNADPDMESRMARLPNSGSFYWPNALRAYVWARHAMRTDPTIEQVAIETISARPIGRIYR